MKKLQHGFTAIELLTVVVLVASLGGWIANIVKLVGMDFSHIGGMLIVRVIGIFMAPLGAVMGFL
jgi:prepilin-type N-terminal cleavage/methylation domain-containing protein